MPFEIDILSLITGGVVFATLTFVLLRARAARTEGANATLAERLDEATHKLAEREERIAALSQENTALQTTLKHKEESFAEQRKLLEQAEARMKDAFKVLSSEILHENRDQFLSMAQQKLKQFQEGAKVDLDKSKSAIHDTLKRMDEKLTKFDTARGEINKHLEMMAVDQKKLRDETSTLVQALRSPTARGQWGEMQLMRTLELAGMVEGQHFTRQETVTGEGGSRQRPDVIVKMPGGQNIIVDSKAPMEAYLNAHREDATPDDRKRELTKHAQHVKDHMRALGQKKYWEQFDTPELVVMFLPDESYFSAAVHQDPGLIDFGVDQRVLPATPTTLIALLRSVMYGWKQQALAENARHISELGAELYTRLCTFGEHMDKVGRGLKTANNSYNQAVKSLDSRVMPAARRFEELHAAPTGKQMNDLDQLDHEPLSLTAPDFTGPAGGEIGGQSDDTHSRSQQKTTEPA